MKVVTIVFIFFTTFVMAQPGDKLPAGAEAFYNKALAVMKPVYKSFILQSATSLRGHSHNLDSLGKAIRGNALFKNLSQMDVTALTEFVLVQTAKDTDADIQATMLLMRSTNQSKQLQRDIVKNNKQHAAKLDSIMKAESGTMSQSEKAQSVQLATLQNQQAITVVAIGNLMQKIGNMQEAIINNLK